MDAHASRIPHRLQVTPLNSGSDFGHWLLLPRLQVDLTGCGYRLRVTIFDALANESACKTPDIARKSLKEFLVKCGAKASIFCNAHPQKLAPAFTTSRTYDPAQVRWITQLENILTQSYTEQPAYDFKQGFLRLDGEHKIDEEAFEKILKTLVGIANIRRGVKGYVLVGIADKETDANRILKLYNVKARQFESFFITGVEHEAISTGKTLDQLFQTITDRIKKSKISEPLRGYVARNLKFVRYFEKAVFILESQAQDVPSHIDGEYFVRHGNELEKVSAENFSELFRRFQAGL